MTAIGRADALEQMPTPQELHHDSQVDPVACLRSLT